MASGHDADPVLNPSADRAEVLRLGCVVPAHLLDARPGRRQLLPQRNNFTPAGLAKIFGDNAGVVSRHGPAEWLTAVSRQGESLPAAADTSPISGQRGATGAI